MDPAPAQATPPPASLRETVLTSRQLERRERILDTAIELASEGGYEAVQMRDVASKADVALGTLYRYFASKDQLLAAAWGHWAARLEPRITTRPLRGETMAERATDFLHRATRAFERNPRLAAAVLTTVSSSDASALAPQRQASQLIARMLMGVMEPLDPVVAGGVVGVLNHAWHSALLGWVSGQSTIGEVYDALDEACHLLLDPREPA